MAENTESILIIVMVFGILIISSIFLLFRNKKQIPDIITDLEIKPDNSDPKFGSAKLSWTPPNHNSSKIIEYQIEFQNTNEKSWTGVVTCASFHTLSQLKKGGTYRFKIASKNTVGLSNFSEIKEKFFTSNTLDSYQQDAVSFNHGTPLLVTAGPGSGKTRVVSERVKDLILNQNVAPEKILCITFTKSGQKEMQKRFDTDSDLKHIDFPINNIRTFHSLCVEYMNHPQIFVFNENHNDNELIRKYTLEGQGWIDYCKKNFHKFNFEQLSENEETIEQLIDGVSSFKRENLSLNDLDEHLITNSSCQKDVEYDEKLNDLYKYFKKYNEYLCQKDQKDFDDILFETSKKLDKVDFRESKIKDIEHLIIDEFQDNNFLQFKIVKQLTSSQNITAVGDRNQSIYSFQGANIELFNDFEQNYPDYKSLSLKYNYRSTPQIINTTNNFVNTFDNISKNHFSAANSNGPPVHIREFDNIETEFDYFFNLICSNINSIIQKNSKTKESVKFSDFAILVRTNEQRLKLKRFLVGKGIPCRTKTFTTIEYANSKVSSFIQHKVTQIGLTPNSSISEFWEKLFDLSSKTTEYSSNLNLDFEESISSDNESYMDAVLFCLLIQFFEHRKDAKISEFLKYIQDPNQQNKISKKYPKWDFINAVEIGTVHSVKGKEFPFVLVSNTNKNKFPLKFREREIKVPYDLLNYKNKISEISGDSTLNIDEILHSEEEARLYYVAMTRAKIELFLTFALMDEKNEILEPSTYLDILHFKNPQSNLDYKKIFSTSDTSDSVQVDDDSVQVDDDSVQVDDDSVQVDDDSDKVISSTCVGMYFYSDLINPDVFLNICSPWISPSIIEDLIRLSEQKIKIRIITFDDSSNLQQQKSIALLKQVQNDYLKYRITKIQNHSKYFIKDDDLLIDGTANLTKTSLYIIKNKITIIRDKDQIMENQKIFETDWNNY